MLTVICDENCIWRQLYDGEGGVHVGIGDLVDHARARAGQQGAKVCDVEDGSSWGCNDYMWILLTVNSCIQRCVPKFVSLVYNEQLWSCPDSAIGTIKAIKCH